MISNTFLGVVYLIVIVGTLILFLSQIKKDPILAFTYFFAFAISVGFFIPFTYYQTSMDLNNGIITNEYYLDAVNKDNIQSNDFLFTDQKDVHAYDFFAQSQFDFGNIDNMKVLEFCFYYNNSDDINVVHIHNGYNDLSPDIIIPNQSVGILCAFLNKSTLLDEKYLGIHCDDCLGGNELSIQTDLNSDSTIEYIFDIVSGFDSVHEHEAHLFFIRASMNPSDQINDNFWWYLKFMGIVIFVMLMRVFYVTFVEGIKYD